MSETTEKQTMGFQAEVKQLLNLMIHSLYSNKEIFLRELISNASDAADKLRFEALKDDSLLSADPELKIRVEFDSEAGTLSISDNGVGMSKQEVIDNLGTIAKSGTAQFLDKLTGDERKDSQLIGQFGVGFYSVFVVAEQADVFTRRAGVSAEAGVHWSSKGEGEFSIEPFTKADRGTKIVLKLREDDKEFANDWKLRRIVTKYSDHISLPIEMLKREMPSAESESEDKDAESKQEGVEEKVPEYEVVNKATALWTRSKSELKDEDYKGFYKHVGHDFNDPLTWSHNRVEGKLEYTSLLYIPKRAPFDMYNREAPKGLKLYVQRVFIMDDAEQFLPLYLRFVKGIVDSNDIPLNVSREILQNNKITESMKSALTKRVLDTLTKLANDKPDDYAVFWKEFGQVLKEGPAEDYANREKVAGLFRFASTRDDSAKASVSLSDYVGRMKEGQDKIYYVTGEAYQAAIASPHLEIFKKKGIEVLVLVDRIDEWMVASLSEFDGKSLQNIAKGELDLGKLTDEEEKKETEKLQEESKDLIDRIKAVLGDKVAEVRATNRLTDSPACLVIGEHDMGAQMRQIMEAAGQALPDTKPNFEVNPGHPLVAKLGEESQEDRFADLTSIIFDQASLAEGGDLNDPAAYVKRINKLLLEMSD